MQKTKKETLCFGHFYYNPHMANKNILKASRTNYI